MSDQNSTLQLPVTPMSEDERPVGVRLQERRRAEQHFEKMGEQQTEYFVEAVNTHLEKQTSEEKERDKHAQRPPRVPGLHELDDILIDRVELDELWNTDDGLLGDDFFAIHAENLFAKITLLVSTHFKQGPVSIPDEVSPWGMKGGQEEDTALEQYAKRIARPDVNHPRPWEELLRVEDPRLLLLVGVIMRMLDDHVFSRMLFGASPEEERQLQELDMNQLDDGFARSRVRSAMVNLMLQRNGGIPVHFWNHVDELTHAIAMQLHPVLTYVWLSKPAEEYTFERFYQHVHHQVAFAGWWAVQMRRSPAIVTFRWPTPGTPWEDKMEHVGSVIYEGSQVIAKLLDDTAALENGTRKPIRRARVLVVANPEIRRYLPQIEGHNDFRILRTFVACYHGLYFDQKDEEQFLNHGKAPEDFDADLVQYALTRREIRRDQEREKMLQRSHTNSPTSLLIVFVLLFLVAFPYALLWMTGMTATDVWNIWVAPQVARALELAESRITASSNPVTATVVHATRQTAKAEWQR